MSSSCPVILSVSPWAYIVQKCYKAFVSGSLSWVNWEKQRQQFTPSPSYFLKICLTVVLFPKQPRISPELLSLQWFTLGAGLYEHSWDCKSRLNTSQHVECIANHLIERQSLNWPPPGFLCCLFLLGLIKCIGFIKMCREMSSTVDGQS